MHVLLEGVLPYELSLVLYSFIYVKKVQMDAGVTETQQFVFVLCLTIQLNMNSLFDTLFGTDYQIEYEENI